MMSHTLKRSLHVLRLVTLTILTMALFTTLEGCAARLADQELPAAMGQTPAEAQMTYTQAIGSYRYKRARAAALRWKSLESAPSIQSALALMAANNALADLAANQAEALTFLEESLQIFGTLNLVNAPRSAQAAAEFYGAEAMGMKIRIKGIEMIAMLSEVAKHAEQSIALDPSFENGAATRLLGMLLLKAPGWPQSIGDSDRAIKLLQQVVKENPNHPQGWIHQADALMDISRVQEAQKSLTTAAALLGTNPRIQKLYQEVKARIQANQKMKAYE